MTPELFNLTDDSLNYSQFKKETFFSNNNFNKCKRNYNAVISLHGDISDLEAKKNYLNPLIHFNKSYYREK